MSKMFKLTSLVVGLAMVLSFVAVPASAATIDELMAQIATLTAQIAALKGGATATTATTFTRDLTVGSKGEDVSALQQILIDSGYLDVVAPTGYFGGMTKAALVKYQKENGISATGYFGPKTRAFVGSTATTGGTTTTTTTTVADGSDGSITVTLDNYVGNQTLKKGETKDIYAAKMQATAGKVAINRFDVRMNVRPWLYFNKLVLKDSSGAVIAEKSISGSSDATELTAGTSYLVRFDNINYVVEPGNNKVLVVSASVLPTTDKLTNDVSVKVMIGPSGIRTINGKGFTDSLSLGASDFTGDIRTVTLSGSNSQGNIIARLNSGSPLTRVQAISTSGETAGVVLGAYDVKSENQNSTIERLTINLGTNGADPSTFIKRLYLSDGVTTYNADSIAASSTFTSLKIALVKDEWKTLTLKADIADADDITGVASTTATLNVYNGSNPTGVDANYSSLTGTANAVSASKVTFSTNSLSVSNMGVTSDGGLVAVANGPIVRYPVHYTFTLTNNGNTNLYVSKTAGVFIGTTTVPALNATSTLTEIQPIAEISGDESTAYVITSNGGSRTFTLNGTIGQAAGTSGSSLKISTINYGTTSAGTGSTITTGLEPLYKSFNF